MKKFEFRLESALRLRLTQLEGEKMKLQALLAEDQRLRIALSELDSERRKASSTLQTSAEISALDVRALSAFMIGAEARRNNLSKQIGRQSHLIAEGRTRVMLAERNVKLLENLKNKRRSEWQAEWDRELESNAQQAWLSAHRST